MSSSDENELDAKKNSEIPNDSDPELGNRALEKRSLSQRFLTWTLEDVFDFNPTYAKSLRGILNICHIVFSMFVMALVGSACHLQLNLHVSSTGFYCKSPDTFIFVIACSSFIHSFLFFMCCLLSKSADKRLLVTSYEIVYYVTYAVFFCIASVALTSSVVTRNKLRAHYEEQYHITLGGGVFGVINTIAYTGSSIWFFIYHNTHHPGCEHNKRDPERNIQ